MARTVKDDLATVCVYLDGGLPRCAIGIRVEGKDRAAALRQVLLRLGSLSELTFGLVGARKGVDDHVPLCPKGSSAVPGS